MTFSIAALDPVSGRVGVAITTSSIAVGSRCPWVRAGVGTVATQNITDPSLGPAILDKIQSGDGARDALDKVVQSRSNLDYRQLTVVDSNGQSAHYTGKHTLGTNAVFTGNGCVAAGNLLANDSIPKVMIETFGNRDTNLHLAESLLLGLKAGLDAGGEEGTLHSAAILVASEYSWPEVDLRVDWDDADPIGRLLDLWAAYKPQYRDYIMRAISPDKAPSYGVPGDP